MPSRSSSLEPLLLLSAVTDRAPSSLPTDGAIREQTGWPLPARCAAGVKVPPSRKKRHGCGRKFPFMQARSRAGRYLARARRTACEAGRGRLPDDHYPMEEERSVPEPLRLGVLGTGSISLRGILPHCTMPDVQDRLRVTAVCDTVPGRARAAAERFGVPQAFESYEELLREGECDAVSIATPIGLHYEQGKAAVDAGKHVHFNKTMTTTAAE